MVRAGPLHGQGRGFESLIVHQSKIPKGETDGSDSRVKAELGHVRVDNAGLGCEYPMVFLEDGGAVPGVLKVYALPNTPERL